MRLTRIIAGAVAVAAIAIATYASRRCTPSIPARGAVALVPVNTTVDSDVARYLIEDYFQGRRRDPRVDQQIDSVRSRDLIAAGNAQRVAQRFSADVAALLLAAQLMQENRDIQRTYEDHLARPARDRLRGRAMGLTVLFVPGWLYRRHPETGASLEREIAALRQNGIDARRIPTDENGSIEDNARVIVTAIRDVRTERLIVVSASKGGPETMLALDSLDRPEDLRRIVAWVNVGGILGGSPLADDALTIPRRWLTGIVLLRHCEGVASMTRAIASKRPGHVPRVRTVNFVAIPLSGDVTPQARAGYCALRRFGPNDGLTLIADEILPGSLTITSLGSDHYFRRFSPEARAIALLETVLDLELDVLRS